MNHAGPLHASPRDMPCPIRRTQMEASGSGRGAPDDAPADLRHGRTPAEQAAQREPERDGQRAVQGQPQHERARVQPPLLDGHAVQPHAGRRAGRGASRAVPQAGQEMTSISFCKTRTCCLPCATKSCWSCGTASGLMRSNTPGRPVPSGPGTHRWRPMGLSRYYRTYC